MTRPLIQERKITLNHFITSTYVNWLTGFHCCFSCPSEDYGIQCIQATCKLLEKICKRIHYYSYAQNFTEIPVACMNLVASVSGFAQVYHSAIFVLNNCQ